MTAPRLDLGELRRLHEAATPGPWETSRIGDEPYMRLETKDQGLQISAFLGAITAQEGNMALIAAMRNALPALLSIAEAAEAFMSEEHDCDDDQPCLYHDALSAALAAVRKGEKGD